MRDGDGHGVPWFCVLIDLAILSGGGWSCTSGFFAGVRVHGGLWRRHRRNRTAAHKGDSILEGFGQKLNCGVTWGL